MSDLAMTESTSEPEPGQISGQDSDRDRLGRFAKGHGATKPRGTRHWATRQVAAIFAEGGEEVARTVVGKALDGDMMAARLVIERLHPPLRDIPREPLEGLELGTESGALAALQEIALRAADGTLRPEEAKAIAELIVTVIQVHRSELETQVTAALQQVRDLLAGQQDLPKIEMRSTDRASV
jgi:hypothetical protein